MGTGAVYVTLAGLKGHPGPLTNVEAIFFFINLTLFILNSSTLLLQAICAMIFLWACSLSHYTHIVVYPQQSMRLINDPVKGLFVPLLVRTRTIVYFRLKSYTRSCHLRLSWSEPSITELFRAIFPWRWYTFSFGEWPCNFMRIHVLIVTRIYVFLAVLVSFPMLMIWYNKPHDVTTFTPAWAFLVRNSLFVDIPKRLDDLPCS